jgi:hypothetical protein
MADVQKFLWTKKQWNGFVALYSDPQGDHYDESWGFQTLNESLFATVNFL